MPICLNETLYQALTYKHRGASTKYTKAYFNGKRVLGGTPTPPPVPPTPPEDPTKCLWHFDDVGEHPVDAVSGLVMSDTTSKAPADTGVAPTSKFGNGLINAMPATRVDSLVIPVGSVNHENQNWTLEAWVYYRGRYYTCGFMGMGAYYANGSTFMEGYYLGWATPYTSYDAPDQQAYFLAGATERVEDRANIRNNGTLCNFAQNTWHHVALVKSGTTLCGFLNGVLVAQADNVPYVGTHNAYQNSGESYHGPQFLIRQDDAFGCGVDEVRISNTARYTANFTPPTEPFAAN